MKNLTFKRVLSILLTLILTISLLSVTVLGAEGEPGTPDTLWYVGHEDDTTYEISTADQLAGLAQLVNDTAGLGGPVVFAGKTITLATDIDLSAYAGGEGWTPIGALYGFSARLTAAGMKFPA